MYCKNCGTPLDPSMTVCKKCEHDVIEAEVEVLTPEEKDSFQGVTIDTNEAGAQEREREQAHSRQSVYFKHSTLNLSQTGFLFKFLLAALIIFMMVVILPIALLVFGAVVIGWILLRQLR